jgi:hypothetical protein
MLNKKSFAIIYLDRNSFTYYTEHNDPMTFTYPSASVRELEVINEEILSKEALLFVQSNKIIPAMLMFILSPDTFYEKDFIDDMAVKSEDKSKVAPDIKTQAGTSAKTDQMLQNPTENISGQDQRSIAFEERARQIQLFLDIVPIDELASKTYKIDKGVKVVATNKHLYETIINVFNKQLFIVDSVVPFSMLPKELISGTGMNQGIVKMIIKKFELVSQSSLLVENSYSLSRAATEGIHLEMTTKMSSKKDYALVGVFVCLLLILGVVAYTTVILPNKTKVASIVEVLSPTPPVLPTVIITATPTATTSADIKNISILINGGLAMQSDLVKQDLISGGFSNVTVEPGNIPSTGKALVIFSSTLEESIRTYLLEQLRHNLLNISVQESASPEADIIVNL